MRSGVVMAYVLFDELFKDQKLLTEAYKMQEQGAKEAYAKHCASSDSLMPAAAVPVTSSSVDRRYIPIRPTTKADTPPAFRLALD